VTLAERRLSAYPTSAFHRTMQSPIDNDNLGAGSPATAKGGDGGMLTSLSLTTSYLTSHRWQRRLHA